METNNSPLRLYIYRAYNNGINRATAWEVWQSVLAPRATASIFNAEWKACETGGYDNTEFRHGIRMSIGEV